MLAADRVLNLPCADDRGAATRKRCDIMPINKQKSGSERHADQSAWVIWAVLVVIAVAILPFTVRNSEIVRQLAAMCGFTLN